MNMNGIHAKHYFWCNFRAYLPRKYHMPTLTSAMSSEASGEEHHRKAGAAVMKTVSPASRTARVHAGVKPTPTSGKNLGQSGNDRKKIIGLMDCSKIGARKQDLVGSRKKPPLPGLGVKSFKQLGQAKA
jgi:hypothetical protein